MEPYQDYDVSIDSLLRNNTNLIINYVNFDTVKNKYILWKDLNEIKMIRYDLYGAYIPILTNDSIDLSTIFTEIFDYYNKHIINQKYYDTVPFEKYLNLDYSINHDIYPKEMIKTYTKDTCFIFTNFKFDKTLEWKMLIRNKINLLNKTVEWHVLDSSGNTYKVTK